MVFPQAAAGSDFFESLFGPLAGTHVLSLLWLLYPGGASLINYPVLVVLLRGGPGWQELNICDLVVGGGMRLSLVPCWSSLAQEPYCTRSALRPSCGRSWRSLEPSWGHLCMSSSQNNRTIFQKGASPSYKMCEIAYFYTLLGREIAPSL